MLRQKALEIACLLPTDDKDNRNSPLKSKVTTAMMMEEEENDDNGANDPNDGNCPVRKNTRASPQH